MAEAVIPAEEEAQAPDEEEQASDAPPAPAEEPLAQSGGSGRRYRSRFGIVYAVLGLILGVAIAGFIVLVIQPGREPKAAWSSWQPASDPDAALQEIAAHVSAEYHLPSGRQLVSVQAAPPRVQDVPIGAIAIRRPAGDSSPAEPITVFPVEGAVVYILCGLGPDCAIEEGKPSAERLRLLRRESLELALYTFRYIDGKNSVVAFLPPTPGEKPALALFFQRGELGAELDQPLRTTLPAPEPPLPDEIPSVEVQTIDRLTAPHLFRFSFQQLQDGTAVLVLDDPTSPAPAETQDTTGQGTTDQSTTDQSTTEPDSTSQ